MNRGDEFIFKNRNTHIQPPRNTDEEAHVYCYKGRMYYRIGYGLPHLIAGVINITQEISSSGGGGIGKYIRAGNVMLDVAGEYNFVFSTPLGTTGLDYNLTVFATDSSGARMSFDQFKTDQTKYGFKITTYDPNVFIEWTAMLKTQ
jgi:hypothetical protein